LTAVHSIDRHITRDRTVRDPGRTSQNLRVVRSVGWTVDRRVTDGKQRVVTLPQKSRIGPWSLNRLSPTEVAGHINVRGNRAVWRGQVFAHRSHAGRIGVLRF